MKKVLDFLCPMWYHQYVIEIERGDKDEGRYSSAV